MQNIMLESYIDMAESSELFIGFWVEIRLNGNEC